MLGDGFRDEARLDDLIRFAERHVATGDIDPAYPVLGKLCDGLDDEAGLWLTVLYVSHYNLASGLLAFDRQPVPGPLDDFALALPKATERRAHRQIANLIRHIDSMVTLAEAAHGFRNLFAAGFGADPQENWRTLQANLLQPFGNGRWAAYKTGEILFRVHGWPVQPTDMGHSHSSGPRQGLSMFYPPVAGNDPQAVAVLDRQSLSLQARVAEAGLDLSIEQLETVLCDFHAMSEGRYYIGHDIESLWTQIQQAKRMHGPTSSLLTLEQAMREVFDDRFLVIGPDPVLKRAYRDLGVIVER